MESESLDFIGLEIPRDYISYRVMKMNFKDLKDVWKVIMDTYGKKPIKLTELLNAAVRNGKILSFDKTLQELAGDNKDFYSELSNTVRQTTDKLRVNIDDYWKDIVAEYTKEKQERERKQRELEAFKEDCQKTFKKVNNVFEDIQMRYNAMEVLEKNSQDYYEQCNTFMSEFEDRKKTLKILGKKVEKLSEKEIFKNAVDENTKTQWKEFKTNVAKLEQDMTALYNSVTEQGLENMTEMKDAMDSFNAIKNVPVKSKHADQFTAIIDAVNNYDGIRNEVESATNLYKACREYLNCHTSDGRSNSIGGQGSLGGRYRKQAVVKLLEVMEKNAEKQFVFKNAKEEYAKFYKESKQVEACPALDISALKRSLAKGSDAKVDKAIKNNNERMMKKAYAELESRTKEYRNDIQKADVKPNEMNEGNNVRKKQGNRMAK